MRLSLRRKELTEDGVGGAEASGLEGAGGELLTALTDFGGRGPVGFRCGLLSATKSSGTVLFISPLVLALAMAGPKSFSFLGTDEERKGETCPFRPCWSLEESISDSEELVASRPLGVSTGL